MEALVKALGPIGMVRYLEEYDNGGTGDYTIENYDGFIKSLLLGDIDMMDDL